MKKIYIYTLSDPQTNIIKYVGKTNNLKQRFNQHIYSGRHQPNHCKKNSWITSLLNKNLKPKMEVIDEIEGEWEWLEEFWIEQLIIWGFPLKNMTKGGGGKSGFKVSDITKEKMSLSKKGKTPKNYNLFRDSTKKGEIIQYNLNGKEIRKFETVGSAKRKTGISNIDLVVKHKRLTAGNFIWRYTNNPLLKKDIIFIKKELNKQKPKIILQKNKNNGVIIKEWGSVNEVKKKYKHINAVLRGERKSAGGYFWEYK